MKKLLLIPLVVLAACATTETSCYQKVAAARVALDEAAGSIPGLLQANIINTKTSGEIKVALKASDEALDQAAKFCAISEPKALDYLALANDFLLKIPSLTQGE